MLDLVSLLTFGGNGGNWISSSVFENIKLVLYIISCFILSGIVRCNCWGISGKGWL